MKILYFLFLIFQLIQGSIFHHHLSAKPKYIQNWDTIDLSWSLLLEQRPDDWVGIYSPPESKDSEYISSKEIKKTKQEEEGELNSWEREMQIVKQEIEKIDKELFSKLE